MRGVATTSLTILICLSSFAGCTRDPGPRPPTVAELTEMLGRNEPETQIRAASWVQQLGPKAADTKPALLSALKSPDAGVRQSAALALSKIGAATASDAIPALTTLLSDPEVTVRQSAAVALGEFGPAAASALPALEALSQTTDGCKATSDSAIKKIRS